MSTAKKTSAKKVSAKKLAVVALVLKPPLKTFRSKGGRSFSVKEGVHTERWLGDPLWSDSWPIFYKGKQAGKLFRNLAYGTTKKGKPRWQATIRELYWAYATGAPSGPGKGIGYDVAAFDTPTACVAAWSRSADQILDYAAARAA
jgi:hypothetical protein